MARRVGLTYKRSLRLTYTRLRTCDTKGLARYQVLPPHWLHGAIFNQSGFEPLVYML